MKLAEKILNEYSRLANITKKPKRYNEIKQDAIVTTYGIDIEKYLMERANQKIIEMHKSDINNLIPSNNYFYGNDKRKSMIRFLRREGFNADYRDKGNGDSFIEINQDINGEYKKLNSKLLNRGETK